MSLIAERIVRSWSSRGPLACALWPIAILMGLLVGLRRLLYRTGLLTSESPGLPVLVVGNRVVGGAGKTPATIAIVQHLQAKGWRPGVLSRGYKRTEGADPLTPIDVDTARQLGAADVGDEPLLIWRRTQAPLMVGRDRVAGGRALRLRHPELDILVCDDGLQHARLARQIDVVVFDDRGAGNGWLLPAGPLREPIAPRPPASLVAPPIVLYNAARASTSLSGHLVHRSMAPFSLLDAWWSGDATAAANQPPSEGAWAVAGIAHPPKFFAQLRAMGLRGLREVACADHDPYANLPWPEGIPDVIVTEKDAIKLSPDRVRRERPGTRVWVAVLDFRPDPGFWQALDAALARLGRPTLPPT